MAHLSGEKMFKRWYSLKAHEDALGIRVDPKAWLEALAYLTADNPAIMGLQETEKLPPFIPPNGNGTLWGFGEIVESTRTDDGWIDCMCPLPEMGMWQKADWERANVYVNTYAILLNALNRYEGVEPIEKYSGSQLLLLEIYHHRNLSAPYPISATLGPAAVDWMRRMLEKYPANEYITRGDVELTMRKTYDLLSNRTRPLWDKFEAYLKPPCTIVLSCPGNACDLGGKKETDAAVGLEMSSHNVDEPLQQLTLVVGLAALHEFLVYTGL